MTKIKIFGTVLALMLASTANISAQEHLTITKAIELTLDNNYDIKIAAENSNIAEISNSWGYAGRYPTISLNAQSVYGKDVLGEIPGALNTSASANVQWLLFGGMRVNVNKAILELSYNLSRGTEKLQVENSVKAVILAYYAVMVEERLHELYDEVLTLSKDRYERAKSAYELGGSDSRSLLDAEGAYLTDLKRSIQQQRSVRTVVYTLNNLMGVDINTTWEFDTELTLPSAEYSIVEMRERMLSNNTTIQNQYINQKIAEKSIDLEKSFASPTVALIGEISYNNRTMGGNYTATNTLTPAIGATVNFNIFDGLKTKKNIEIAGLTSEAAKLGTDKLKLYLESRLLTNYDEYTFNKQLVEIGTKEVDITKRTMDLSFEKYSNGSLSSFDFRQVQLSYLESLYTQAMNTYALILSNVELTQLIGGILSE